MDLDQEINAEAIVNFVQNVINGSHPKYVLSEDIPSGQSHKYLRVFLLLIQKLVGKTFESEVFDDPESIFVALTAPWCHHCDLVLIPLIKRAKESLQDYRKSLMRILM